MRTNTAKVQAKYVHREPLTSDIVFKAVFGRDDPDSKAALIELLNLILEKEDDPIVDIVYKNPFSISEDITEKVIIMDIQVETSSEELIDVEMQIGELDVYVKRSVYYGCKQLTKGLDKGEDYDKIKKSIVISFIRNKLFPEKYPMHTVFSLRENRIGEQLSDLLELHYIELGKVSCDKADPDQMGPLEQFGAYIRFAGDPEEADFLETLVEKGVKVISMADKVLKKVSEEERLQYMRESREMAEMQLRTEKRRAVERGLKQGIEQGIEQGIKQGIKQRNLEVAKTMKDIGATVEQIKIVTGLTESEIEKL